MTTTERHCGTEGHFVRVRAFLLWITCDAKISYCKMIHAHDFCLQPKLIRFLKWAWQYCLWIIFIVAVVSSCDLNDQKIYVFLNWWANLSEQLWFQDCTSCPTQINKADINQLTVMNCVEDERTEPLHTVSEWLLSKSKAKYSLSVLYLVVLWGDYLPRTH